ncbi:hypothetical protein [Alsobacter sp. SYSU BS001988]
MLDRDFYARNAPAQWLNSLKRGGRMLATVAIVLALAAVALDWAIVVYSFALSLILDAMKWAWSVLT